MAGPRDCGSHLLSARCGPVPSWTAQSGGSLRSGGRCPRNAREGARPGVARRPYLGGCAAARSGRPCPCGPAVACRYVQRPPRPGSRRTTRAGQDRTCGRVTAVRPSDLVMAFERTPVSGDERANAPSRRADRHLQAGTELCALARRRRGGSRPVRQRRRTGSAVPARPDPRRQAARPPSA
jgi:hypothetical protein